MLAEFRNTKGMRFEQERCPGWPRRHGEMIDLIEERHLVVLCLPQKARRVHGAGDLFGQEFGVVVRIVVGERRVTQGVVIELLYELEGALRLGCIQGNVAVGIGHAAAEGPEQGEDEARAVTQRMAEW